MIRLSGREILVRLIHPLNTALPRTVIPSGTSADVRYMPSPDPPSNCQIPSSSFSTDVRNSLLRMPEYPMRMFAVLSFPPTVFSFSQPRKAPYSTAQFSALISRLLRFTQPQNASAPISVIPAGIVTPVILILSLNAESQIRVTEYPSICEGITTTESLPIYRRRSAVPLLYTFHSNLVSTGEGFGSSGSRYLIVTLSIASVPRIASQSDFEPW